MEVTLLSPAVPFREHIDDGPKYPGTSPSTPISAICPRHVLDERCDAIQWMLEEPGTG